MPNEAVSDLAERYPNLNAWVFGGGWVEIGEKHFGQAFARVLHEREQVWEGKRKYGSLEEVLKALDQGIGEWLQENG